MLIDASRKSPRRRWAILLVVLSSALYLVGNEAVALWDRDEPRNAQASRQMFQSGDWVVPRFLDEVRTAKPVFIYWCQASAMKLFGGTAFAARFPSAIAMTLSIVVLLVALSREMGIQQAIWAAFVFATAGLTIAAAKMALTDSVLLLWIIIAQLCLYRMTRGQHDWPTWIAMGIAVGVGGLTKGPIPLGVMGMTLATLLGMRFLSPLPIRRGRLGGGALTPLCSTLGRGGERGLSSGSDIAERADEDPSPSLSPEYRGGEEEVAASFRVAREEDPSPNLSPEYWREEEEGEEFSPVAREEGPSPRLSPEYWREEEEVAASSRVAREGDPLPGLSRECWREEEEIASPGLLLDYARGGRAEFKTIKVIVAFIITCAICAPWLILISQRAPNFLPTIIGHDVMKRMSSGLEGHSAPPGFYLLTIWGTFFPWSLLLPGALLYGWRHRADALTRFALASVIGPWLMFELVRTKLPHYLLPIFPGLAVLTAKLICDVRPFPRIHRIAIGLGVAVFPVVAVVYGLVLPHVAALRISPNVASYLRTHGATAAGDVIMIDYKEPTLAFYQGGTIREESDNAYLQKTDPWRWPTWIVLTDTIWRSLPAEVQSHLRVATTVKGFWYSSKARMTTVMVVKHLDGEGSRSSPGDSP